MWRGVNLSITTAVTIALALSTLLSDRIVSACPFCSAQSQTLTQEMESMDVVVLATLAVPAPLADTNDADSPAPKGKFDVTHVLKGGEWIKEKARIDVLYYGEAPVGTTFLVMSVVEGKEDKQHSLVWSTPMKVSTRAGQYLRELGNVPKSGTPRLLFFQKHLEDKEDLLARDAYDEFALAPYSDVIALKDHMQHDQLVSWIRDENVLDSRRRLYLTMLGVCGTKDDLPMLEAMIRQERGARKAALDALLACYLTLSGESGVSLLEDLYLKNEKAEYADINSAIMALRFHGTETKQIPLKRIVEATRLLLNRPHLADLIIPDLARWEDWESLDRMVELFRVADTKSTWVREPVVNFVKACPLPEAKDKLKELEKIDPEAVKRANRFFPFGPPKPPADTSKSTTYRFKPSVGATTSAVAAIPANADSESTGKSVAENGETTESKKTSSLNLSAPSANLGTRPADAARKKLAPVANRWLVLGVAAGAALVLMVAQWSALKSGSPSPRGRR